MISLRSQCNIQACWPVGRQTFGLLTQQTTNQPLQGVVYAGNTSERASVSHWSSSKQLHNDYPHHDSVRFVSFICFGSHPFCVFEPSNLLKLALTPTRARTHTHTYAVSGLQPATAFQKSTRQCVCNSSCCQRCSVGNACQTFHAKLSLKMNKAHAPRE